MDARYKEESEIERRPAITTADSHLFVYGAVSPFVHMLEINARRNRREKREEGEEIKKKKRPTNPPIHILSHLVVQNIIQSKIHCLPSRREWASHPSPEKRNCKAPVSKEPPGYICIGRQSEIKNHLKLNDRNNDDRGDDRGFKKTPTVQWVSQHVSPR